MTIFTPRSFKNIREPLGRIRAMFLPCLCRSSRWLIIIHRLSLFSLLLLMHISFTSYYIFIIENVFKFVCPIRHLEKKALRKQSYNLESAKAFSIYLTYSIYSTMVHIACFFIRIALFRASTQCPFLTSTSILIVFSISLISRTNHLQQTLQTPQVTKHAHEEAPPPHIKK